MTRIKLLTWNCNGLRALYKKGFKDIIAELDADIVCLQEIKSKVEQLSDDIINIPGYDSWFNPAERPGYSGVAVYSKLEPKNVEYGIDNSYFDNEGRVLSLDFESYKLMNIYFPNGGASKDRLRYKMEFYQAISEYAGKEKQPLLICGDVNTAHKEIDLARPKENEKRSGFLPMERQWIDEFLGLGFIDTYREFVKEGGNYSWWDMKTRARERNVGWRIDYFFAAKELLPHVKDAYLLPEIMGSDHCPMVLEMEI